MSDNADSWHRAALCLRLLSLDPHHLGGAVIRMRAGPARDKMLELLEPLEPRRIHPTISDEQLLGGLDLTATLNSYQLIENSGIFNIAVTCLLTMSERCDTSLAAKLSQKLDLAAGHCIIALDEGADVDEATPPALAERLAFHVEPEGRMPVDWPVVPAGTPQIDPAAVTTSAVDIETLTLLAAQFGIDSMRAPLLAVRVARTHAALMGRHSVMDEDLKAAAELVYPQRATTFPQEDAQNDTPAPPEPEAESEDGSSDQQELQDGDMMVDAVRALLPADLLAGLVPAGTTGRSNGSGAGQKRKGNRRGRPLPSRPGRLDGSARIDLVATLRAAAPWQPIRRKAQPDRLGLLIRSTDIRLKRYQDHSDRLLIFTVDASGSAAMSRLNEAKGAVELLLAQAYAARDHVALISFRGTSAELMLPPTRSLVQTKRRLADLPGGGGTPLASGLQEALLLAKQSRTKGLMPTVVILTDGRSNVALDGAPNRALAAADSERIASILCAESISSLIIDMSSRPQEALRALAGRLGGPYLALPRADAHRLTSAVSAALEA